MPTFRYENVKKALAETIARDLKPGDRLAPLEELAAAHSVSKNTVKRAVDDLIASRLLIKRGGRIFVLDSKGPSLRIGFIYPWTMQQLHSYQWHHDLILHVQQEVTAEGHELIVLCDVAPEPQSPTPEGFLRTVQSLDGILFFNVFNNQIVYDALAQGVPMLLLHHVQPIHNVDRVDADGAGGVRMAMEHLIGLGHRRIGFLTDRSKSKGGRHLLFEDREEGWSQSLTEAGLSNDRSLILEAPVSEWDEKCTEDFRRMVGGPDPVTAFVCINDIAASYLYKSAHGIGLRVPQDISVVGCENTPLSDLLTPRITSIDIPQDKIAKYAVRKLLGTIADGPNEVLETRFRTRLVVKESTIPPRHQARGITHPATHATSIAAAPAK